MTGNSKVESGLRMVQRRIHAAATAAGRDPASVELLAVSKGQSDAAIREAAAAGQRSFGENRLQEALRKIAATADLPLAWHFIGPVQSNKTRDIAAAFAWVQSIDRLKVAERLNDQRPPELPPLNVCIQVNISGERTKSGVAPAATELLAQSVAALPRLRLRGLMAIPQPTDDAAEQRSAFAQLRHIYERLRGGGLELDTLSMGMSGDLEAAIAEGATMVRVGTDIFGARQTER